MTGITQKRLELVIKAVSDNFNLYGVELKKWVTYVNGGGSAIIQGLTPLYYVILQEKLSTDSQSHRLKKS